MTGPGWYRMGLSFALVAGLVGCAVTNPLAESEEPQRIRILKSSVFKFRALNKGRLVGTIVVNDDVLRWANAASVEGAEVTAIDPDGTVLADPVTADANGNFVIEGLKESRPRIFLHVKLTDVRMSATAEAPREREDYQVTIDAASTYLSDKLQLAAMEKEVPLDKLDSSKVTQTEEIVNIYMKDDERERVLKETDHRLNAYGFDRFMDDHLPVKKAVRLLSPSLTRGWVPPTPTPGPTPTPRPTPPRPSATPTDNGQK